MRTSLFAIVTAACIGAATVACRPEHLTVPAEPIKTVTGSWQIIKATRNGTDITSGFNFTAFRINFADSSYTLDSLVPFIVSKNGKWAFDNPTYPFNMIFTVPDSTPASFPLLFPVTNGQRNIILTFSPGCKNNSYQYTLQQAN